MPTDERTQNYGLPLPSEDNTLEIDVIRLRDALVGADAQMFTNQTLATQQVAAAIQGLVAGTMLVPGWNVSAQNADGSYASDLERPEQYVASRRSERVRVRYTYLSGGAVSSLVVAYSTNNGASYSQVGTAHISLDDRGLCYAINWVTP